MKKVRFIRGQRYVDRRGMVWEITEEPEENKPVKAFSVTKNKDFDVPRSVVKKEWKIINY